MRPDVFPCGGCRSYVYADEGCEHARPVVARTGRTTGRKPSEATVRRRNVAEAQRDLVRALGYPKP